jgi:hypothetical protein
MISKPKRRRGRPPHGDYPEKSAVINFRIRPDTKQALQDAARASGRTLSQECEHQLRRGLIEMGAGPTHAILRIIGRAIDKLVNLKAPNAKWMDDAYLYQQAENALIATLRLFRPEGAPPKESLDFGGTQQGALLAREEFRDVQLADSSIPFAKQSTRQRVLHTEKADLGALADRPQIYGRTAEQTRQEETLGRRFAELMRKAQRDRKHKTHEMTEKEYEELTQLTDQLAEFQADARRRREEGDKL